MRGRQYNLRALLSPSEIIEGLIIYSGDLTVLRAAPRIIRFLYLRSITLAAITIANYFQRELPPINSAQHEFHKIYSRSLVIRKKSLRRTIKVSLARDTIKLRGKTSPSRFAEDHHQADLNHPRDLQLSH